MPGRAFEQELPFYTVYTALWGLCGYPWEKMNLDEATITRDEETSLYIMKVKIGDSPKGPFLRLYVDTSKGYIPIKQEPLKHDGTLMIRYECSDFHQRNGLWIPYRYSWFDPKVNFGAVYEVQEVAVNQPIPSNLLDFEFPEGTIVSDDRIGSTYTVGKASTGQATVVDPCSQSSQSGAVTVTAPATDDQLRAAAVKAKELLEAHSATEKPSPVIEVSPGIVLVTVDESEYKLSVKKYDGTKPVLLDYDFESTELELSSFKNLIDSEDQVIVNINRVQSHTGFASGTLLLQYAGEDKPTKVTFVSAPLPNAS